MEGQAVHAVAGLFHHDLGPVVVGGIGTAGDAVDAVAGVVFDEGVIAAELIGIEFRAHISAAAPAFVADAEVGDFPGLVPSVLASEVCHG